MQTCWKVKDGGRDMGSTDMIGSEGQGIQT